MNWKFMFQSKDMRTTSFNIVMMLFLLAGLTTGCEKLEDTYSDYTGDGPVQYLTKIYDLKAEPRWCSVQLSWNLKSDPGRTAILVEWTDDEKTDSAIIDKTSTSYLVKGLEKDYEYTFKVSAIEQKGEIIEKKSLGDAVYVRPYSYASSEVVLFSRVVSKALSVDGKTGKKLFVTFEPWADNLHSFKVGYFEEGSVTEKFWGAELEDRKNGWPNGQSYALIGDDVDFSKPINVYREGNIALIDSVVNLLPMALNVTLPVFDSEFAMEVREKFGLIGELKESDIENVEELEIDYDQYSLVDVLYFPKLKKLYLGKNRYGTDKTTKSVLVDQESSIGALKVMKDELGLEIYHYGNHYFDKVPEFFDLKNETSKLPEYSYLEPADWTVSVSPADALGFDSGLEDLLHDNNKDWVPQPSKNIRTHTVEVDMKGEQSITGFKIKQASPSDKVLKGPAKMDIEILDENGDWVSAFTSSSVTLGTGEGETTIVRLKERAKTKKVRFTISDNYYKQQYDKDERVYYDYYNVTLSSFMVITGE